MPLLNLSPSRSCISRRLAALRSVASSCRRRQSSRDGSNAETEAEADEEEEEEEENRRGRPTAAGGRGTTTAKAPGRLVVVVVVMLLLEARAPPGPTTRASYAAAAAGGSRGRGKGAVGRGRLCDVEGSGLLSKGESCRCQGNTHRPRAGGLGLGSFSLTLVLLVLVVARAARRAGQSPWIRNNPQSAQGAAARGPPALRVLALTRRRACRLALVCVALGGAGLLPCCRRLFASIMMDRRECEVRGESERAIGLVAAGWWRGRPLFGRMAGGCRATKSWS